MESIKGDSSDANLSEALDKLTDVRNQVITTIMKRLSGKKIVLEFFDAEKITSNQLRQIIFKKFKQMDLNYGILDEDKQRDKININECETFLKEAISNKFNKKAFNYIYGSCLGKSAETELSPEMKSIMIYHYFVMFAYFYFKKLCYKFADIAKNKQDELQEIVKIRKNSFSGLSNALSHFRTYLVAVLEGFEKMYVLGVIDDAVYAFKKKYNLKLWKINNDLAEMLMESIHESYITALKLSIRIDVKTKEANITFNKLDSYKNKFEDTYKLNLTPKKA